MCFTINETHSTTRRMLLPTLKPTSHILLITNISTIFLSITVVLIYFLYSQFLLIFKHHLSAITLIGLYFFYSFPLVHFLNFVHINYSWKTFIFQALGNFLSIQHCHSLLNLLFILFYIEIMNICVILCNFFQQVTFNLQPMLDFLMNWSFPSSMFTLLFFLVMLSFI